MKCPRCGREMTLDTHRKIPLMMCYECGYIEGRAAEAKGPGKSNFAQMQGLSISELAVFLSDGLGVDRNEVLRWLEGTDQA